jgi:hypothetical protein
MQVSTHEGLARRLSRDFRRTLPGQTLMAGARAPNHERRWPKPHHANRRIRALLVTCVRQARRDYMAGRRHEAAFQLGVASHFALDIMVPHKPPRKTHAVCESRFAQVDRDLHYYREVQKGLADGRQAERAAALLFRAASAEPIDFEHRLQVAYLCMQRLAAAVTEEAEPLEIVNRSTEAFVRLATDLENQLSEYRALVQEAFEQGLRGSWDWENADGPDRRLERAGRQIVGAYEVLRADGGVPALHTAVLNKLCLWRFGRRILAQLDELLRWKRGSRHLAGRLQSIKRQYERSAALIRDRANHWDWFSAEWDFWQEKGGLGVKYIMIQAKRARSRPVAEEEEQFRKKCAEALPDQWAGTKRDRLGRHYAGNARARIRLYAVPALVFLAVLVVLWGLGSLSPIQAGLIGAAGTATYLLYARRTLRNLEQLSMHASPVAETVET